MQISAETSRVAYTGNGSQTAFSYTFPIFADGDLEVWLYSGSGNPTLQTLTTHYTVSDEGDEDGGTVTFVTAPTSGYTVVIRRDRPAYQSTDLVNQGRWQASTVEDALAHQIMLIQQLQEEVDRCIKLPVTEVGGDYDVEVPVEAERAGYGLAFDEYGDVTLGDGEGSVGGADSVFDHENVSATITTTGATATNVTSAAITIPVDGHAHVHLVVTAEHSDGSVRVWDRTYRVTRDGSGVPSVGAAILSGVDPADSGSLSTADIDYIGSVATSVIEVTGIAATTIIWRVRVEALLVDPA